MPEGKRKKKYIITFRLKDPTEKIVETSFFEDDDDASEGIHHKRMFKNKAEIPYYVMLKNEEYISFPVARITSITIRGTDEYE